MPSKEIDYREVHRALNITDDAEPNIIATPRGLAIVEIQGELSFPSELPQNLEDKEDQQKFSTDNEGHDVVKFGRLEYQGEKVTMYIGNSQRLLGNITKLETPLAVMKFPKKGDDKSIEIIDIIKQKITFKQRPLPIM